MSFQRKYKSIQRSGGYRRVFGTSLVLCLLALWLPPLAALAQEQEQDLERFEALIAEARQYDPHVQTDPTRHDRDKAVEIYREALNCRPNHPGNLEIEFYMGHMLAVVSIPSKNQRPRHEDARKLFMDVLAKYPRDQVYTVRAGILAGDLCMIEANKQKRLLKDMANAMTAGDPVLGEILPLDGYKSYIDAAHGCYNGALEGLAEIYREVESGEAGEDEQKKDFVKDDTWFKTALNQYQAAYIEQPWTARLGAYEKVIDRFPDTPLARIAAEEARELREGPEWEWPEQAAEKTAPPVKPAPPVAASPAPAGDPEEQKMQPEPRTIVLSGNPQQESAGAQARSPLRRYLLILTPVALIAVFGLVLLLSARKGKRAE